MPETRVGNRALDARPDRMDLRDRPFQPRLVSLPRQFPDDDFIAKHLSAYSKDLILDQGQDGACTGFGLAAVINYLFWKRGVDAAQKRAPKAPSVSPAMLYHMAQIYDEWSGEDYQGSSCRGAMKGWQRHGACREALWPHRDARGNVVFDPRDGWQADAASRTLGAYYRVDRNSVVDLQAAIHEVGAVYASAEVHDGWVKPAARKGRLPLIRLPKTGGPTGGHAFAFVGYDADGFIVQNSWGEKWGHRGFAVLPYADWVLNGTDAWVAVLGAPVVLTGDLASSRAMTDLSLREVADGKSGWFWSKSKRGAKVRKGQPPLSEAAATLHGVVLGNNGRPENRFTDVESAEAAVALVARQFPETRLRGASVPRLAIYAHGGLNSEAASFQRVRILAPYFLANDIHPLFVTWKTGFLESLVGMLENAVARFFGIGPASSLWSKIWEPLKEAKDRAIEVAAEELVVKAVWRHMKDNADAAALRENGGLRLLAAQLGALKAQVPGLEIHLVGHSAGSLILGRLLDLLAGGPEVATCSLFAPACSVGFALEHYKPALESGSLGALTVDGLSDRRELEDTVGPYGKSLLYLVSRALESLHKMPLLGMQGAWGAEWETPDQWNREVGADTGAWRAFAKARGLAFEALDAEHVSDGEEEIAAAHGSFDNDVAVIAKTLRRIRGGEPLRTPVENLHSF